MHRFALVLGLFLFLVDSARASSLPTSRFWPPSGVAPVISPAGNWVAWISGGETNGTLWVAPFGNPGSGHSIPIPEGRGHARDLVWTGSEDLVVLSLGDQGGGGGGFWLLRCPEFALQPLAMPPGFIVVRLFHPQPAALSRICLEGFAADRFPGGFPMPWLDVLTVDVGTGRVVQVARNPGDVVEWFADDSGTARMALAVSGIRQELRVRWEGPRGAAWRTVESWDLAGDSISVLALSPDGSRGWISARLGRDTRGVYEVDVKAGRLSRVLAVDDRFDIDGGLLLSGDHPLSLSWQQLLPQTAWFDEEWKATAEALAGRFPEGIWKPVGVSRDGRRAVVSRVSDRLPPEYAMVSRGEPGGVRGLPWPAGPPVTGAPRSPVEWFARDGEVLTGYVTGVEGQRRKPMVVLVHGGPWTRDVWGWDPESQFLASRGWAVLQVNYRGSSGFGRRFQEAGAGKWAGAPTSDLVDGVRWAIGQGWADPSEVVVVGASFGGFLAFSAITGDEESFHAGVTLGGVFDLPRWFDVRRAHELPYVQYVQRKRLFGATRPDPRWAERRFPRWHRPLLVIQAQDDDVVPAFLLDEWSGRAAAWKVPMTVRTVATGGHRLRGGGIASGTWEEVERWLSRTRRPADSP
ncbi:MAG: S9 family peptidase [Verrucomicrobiales bacterium]|nr:S9 family peptidase [Verrucomicrobiales bacterium]